MIGCCLVLNMLAFYYMNKVFSIGISNETILHRKHQINNNYIQKNILFVKPLTGMVREIFKFIRKLEKSANLKGVSICYNYFIYFSLEVLWKHTYELYT